MSHSPRITAELFVIPVEDAFLIYAPLRGAAFLASAATVNRIAEFQEGHWKPGQPDDEEVIELLRRLEIVDGGEETKPMTHFAGNPQPTSITLFLTTACNLRCTYCYAAAGDTPTRAMPLEVAKRGIDFVVANAVERDEPGLELAYHGGGEPTVNWKTLTESHAYARQRTEAADLKLHAAIASNGVLSDSKIVWIVENLDGASISFDGLPEVHDKHRVNSAGKGSSAQVIRTIRRFEEAGFPYGLRITVTAEHIPRMVESVRYVCSNFRPQRIQVEPAYQLGRWSEAPSAETSDFIAGFRAAAAAAREYGREISFSAARVGSLSNHFCGISQDNFCLTADGQVSACYETFIGENEWSEKFFYGAYEPAAQTYRFNLPVLDHLREQSVEYRSFCEGCYAKWTCGGDCYHKSLAVNGDGEFRGSDRCHIIRELTKDQILARIADAGGLFWHEPCSKSFDAAGKEVLR